MRGYLRVFGAEAEAVWPTYWKGIEAADRTIGAVEKCVEKRCNVARSAGHELGHDDSGVGLDQHSAGVVNIESNSKEIIARSDSLPPESRPARIARNGIKALGVKDKTGLAFAIAFASARAAQIGT